MFVVGKGGVGKSTTAAALALAEADARAGEEAGGARVRLVSTDPAHSLSDLFELDPATGPVHEDVCGAGLTVEEFDAVGFATEWIRSATGPMRELFELGTYLDSEDVDRFLETSLPGLDEIMAALRLGELLDESTAVVVDTAPTGHTLRLLDSGRTLATWTRALEAMARKAKAVAEGLTGRKVRLGTENFVEEMGDGIRRFEEEVLQHASFVVVTRSGEVVREGTDRLIRDLEARGLGVAARVRVADPEVDPHTDSQSDPHTDSQSDPEADSHTAPEMARKSGGTGGKAAERRARPFDSLVVPFDPDLRGCHGLRRWGGTPGRPSRIGRAERDAATSPAGSSAEEELRRLLARRLFFFAGKGGVGKSTCAAASAILAAEEGPVTLVSTDPAGSLDSLFGVSIPPEGIEVVAGLRLLQVDAEAEHERFLRRSRGEVERIFEGMGVAASAQLDRDVMDSLLELAPPGIDEIFALAKVMDLMEEGRRVVVDSAPTGHFLRLVRMPEPALKWVHEIMRVLLKYRSVSSLEGTGERLLDLSRRLKSLREALTDAERTGVFLVTLDEPVVREELDRLEEQVAAAGLPVAARIVNRAGDGSSIPRGWFRASERSEAPRGPGALRNFVAAWEVEGP